MTIFPRVADECRILVDELSQSNWRLPMPCRARLLLTLLAVVAMLAGFPALAPRPAAAVGTADLAVTMVGDAKHLKFGQTITFTVTVSNNGPDAGTAEVGMGF